MKLLSLICCFCFVSSSFWGQKETLVFKITKPESKIEVETADTIFKVGYKNIFTIKSKGDDKIVRVEVLNQKVRMLYPGLYEVTFDHPGVTFIKVHCKNNKGEDFIGALQKMDILPLPKVNLFLCDVKSDSALDIKHLIKIRHIQAKMKLNTFDYKPQVLSYQLVMQGDTFKINGDMIPFSLKNRLYDLNPGDQIQILDAKVMLPNDVKSIVNVPYYNVFLINSDQHTVGERIYINPSED